MVSVGVQQCIQPLVSTWEYGNKGLAPQHHDNSVRDLLQWKNAEWS